MKKFFAFVAVGSFFSTVEEFLTVAVLKRDIPSYLLTLLIVFPTFLTLVFFSSKLLDRVVCRDPQRELLHFSVYGFVGLMFEWFVMNLAPWSNLDYPMLMLLFQLGMFSFWGTVAFAPRLFLGQNELSVRTRKQILAFYIPYLVVVYAIAALVPPNLQFRTIIPLIIFGYFVLDGFYLSYFLQSFRSGVASRDPSEYRS